MLPSDISLNIIHLILLLDFTHSPTHDKDDRWCLATTCSRVSASWVLIETVSGVRGKPHRLLVSSQTHISHGVENTPSLSPLPWSV